MTYKVNKFNSHKALESLGKTFKHISLMDSRLALLQIE